MLADIQGKVIQNIRQGCFAMGDSQPERDYLIGPRFLTVYFGIIFLRLVKSRASQSNSSESCVWVSKTSPNFGNPGKAEDIHPPRRKFLALAEECLYTRVLSF